MSTARITNYGTSYNGPAETDERWYDKCPTDGTVSWPVAGDKNVEIRASDSIAAGTSSLDICDQAELAGEPYYETQEGGGVESYIYPLPQILIQGDVSGGVWSTDGSQHGESSISDIVRVADVGNGKVGSIEAIVDYQYSTYVIYFKKTFEGGVYLTDTSGTRGIFCGYSIDVESDRFELTMTSDPNGTVVIDGETLSVEELKVPETLTWNVVLDYFIKTSCDFDNSFYERNRAYQQKTYQVESKIKRRSIASQRNESVKSQGQWVNTSQSFYSYANLSGTYALFSSSTATGSIDEASAIQTYSWQIPAEKTNYYITPSTEGLRDEFKLHAVDFLDLVTNNFKAEEAFQKFPLFGDLKLRIRKENTRLEFDIMGVYPKLVYEDEFVNRILTATAYGTGSIDSSTAI
jgi:hypothetical protein